LSRAPEKVLLGTDGSEEARLAARAAAGICAGTGAGLHVVHAWQTVPIARLSSSMRTELERAGREKLEAEVQMLNEAGAQVSGADLAEGRPADEILDLAGRLGADLIVVGSRGLGGVGRLALGSVAQEVVYHATCPVLVLRRASSWPPGRVVFAEDGSPAARKASETAAGLCSGYGVDGVLVRAYPQLPEVDVEGREYDARMVEDDMRLQERELMRRAGELEAELGSRPRVNLTVGDPVSCILQASGEEAPEGTLVSLGSRGLGPVGRVRLGSVSAKTLHAARGPVLVHPPHGDQG